MQVNYLWCIVTVSMILLDVSYKFSNNPTLILGINRVHTASNVNYGTRLCTFIYYPQNAERDALFLPLVRRDYASAAHAPTRTYCRSSLWDRVQAALGATRLSRRVVPRRSMQDQAEEDCRSASEGASADWHRQNHVPRNLQGQDLASSPRKMSLFATVSNSSEWYELKERLFCSSQGIWPDFLFLHLFLSRWLLAVPVVG